MKSSILEILQYNRWANQRLLSIIPNDLVDQELVSSFNTIRKTVYHSWDAETIWYERLQKGNITAWPASASFFGGFDEAVQAILDQELRIIQYFELQNDSFLLDQISYKNMKGQEFINTFEQVIKHMVNHTTMHRGQLVTMLRQLGVTTIPSTDMIAYYRENQSA